MNRAPTPLVSLPDPAAARRWCADWRARGRTLGFVPTMGALHDGHLSLVERALDENDAACVSVFVNPLQFNEQRDFERYPRDLGADAQLLEGAGCTMLFTGTLAGFFPGELDARGELLPAAWREPGPSATGLEGDLRPGHFRGVATIVERLFDVVRPDRAYFGHKDFQQTLVVKDLARALGYPAIVVCPTAREASGLARSSRNELLLPADRERAAVLSRALFAARDAWCAGERRPARLSAAMRTVLADGPATLEYAEIRDPERWTRDEPVGPIERAVALVAARLGGVRLIDNLRLDEPA
ncbi:MAG: pantoate--beta-alanine ligase [Planctomycetes bacterium]|nr:pantoate--beta-alanine ligase [Planctomycetota bacterium]